MKRSREWVGVALVFGLALGAKAEPLSEETRSVRGDGEQVRLERQLRLALHKTVDGVDAVRWRDAGGVTVAEGLRVRMPGLEVTRVAFADPAAALSFAERHTGRPGRRETLEVRGQHLLILSGVALDERAVGAQARRASWDGVAETTAKAFLETYDEPPAPAPEGLGVGPQLSDYARRLVQRAARREALERGNVPMSDRGPVTVGVGRPGEYSRHGVGKVTVTLHGQPTELTVFASRLTYSGRVRALLVSDEGADSVIEGLADAFQAFGGAALVVELNAPGGAAQLLADGRTEWEAGLEAVSVAAGFQLGANWAEPFQDDPLIFVEDTFFARLSYTFDDMPDLERKLAAWHRWANGVQPYVGDQTPDALFALERDQLQPLVVRAGGSGRVERGP